MIQGYTTKFNKWDVLTDKELAKNDLLMELFIHKGDCDWNPTLGTTIMDKIFQLKNNVTRDVIIEELKSTINNSPYFSLQDISTSEVENGWIFSLEINYMGQEIEKWVLDITQDSLERFKATGYYPLTIEEE